MNTTIRFAAAIGVGALLAAGVATTAAVGATPGAGGSIVLAASATEPDVTSALTFAREEERMARDLYAALADRYDDSRPFSMISTSEQAHFDAVGTLLDRYDVRDPSSGKQAGSYADPAIQALYDGWLEEGSSSLAAAYQVGVELETRDIADLRSSIAGDLPQDVDAVFERLLQASERHLSAYQRAADGIFGTARGGPGAAMQGMGQGGRRGDMGAGTTGRNRFAADCPYAG